MERSRTPWALVFGNHDSEQGVIREELMETVDRHEYAVAERVPSGISGIGNYVLQVKDQAEDTRAALYSSTPAS